MEIEALAKFDRKVRRMRTSSVLPHDPRFNAFHWLSDCWFISLDFPQVSEPPSRAKIPTEPTQTDTKRSSPKTPGISHHDLLKAGLIKAPLTMEHTYKGQTLKATLSEDGHIVHGKEVFDSLSAADGSAMQAVLGSVKPPACNGWGFWHYRDQGGKLVHMDELRQQYNKARS